MDERCVYFVNVAFCHAGVRRCLNARIVLAVRRVMFDSQPEQKPRENFDRGVSLAVTHFDAPGSLDHALHQTARPTSLQALACTPSSRHS
jgi:hypothetical protein